MINRRPRLPIRSSEDTEGETQRVMAKLERSGNAPTIVRMMANSPHAFRPRVLLADALLNQSSIPRMITETAILRCAVLVKAEYEWEQHSILAASHGITQEALGAIANGDLAGASLSSEQQLAILFCDELLVGRDIDDLTWSRALKQWGAEGVCDLLITVAYWAGFTSLIATGLRLNAGE